MTSSMSLCFQDIRRELLGSEPAGIRTPRIGDAPLHASHGLHPFPNREDLEPSS